MKLELCTNTQARLCVYCIAVAVQRFSEFGKSSTVICQTYNYYLLSIRQTLIRVNMPSLSTLLASSLNAALPLGTPTFKTEAFCLKFCGKNFAAIP